MKCSDMPHPNFFIVGAAKSGTTSLWMSLKQHPDIFMPGRPEYKEPSYFCTYYKYRCRDFNDYLSLFADAKDEKAIGEASHAYLTSPESAGWIRKVFPEAKIIIILRNPVERAYSLYNWMIREGYEWIHPFEKALLVEEERWRDEKFKQNNPQYYYNYLYFHSGLYANQLQRYLRIFAKEQVKVILFEDIKTNILAIMQEIYAFLGVNPKFSPDVKTYNKTRIPLSASAQFFIRQKLGSHLSQFGFSGHVKKRIRRVASSTNLFLGRIRSGRLNTEIYRNLQKRYRNDVKNTARLIERDLQHWLSEK